MNEKQHRYHAYLLRLWQESPQTDWRGSLENPRTGERQHFATVNNLIAAIVQQTQGDPDELAKLSQD